MTKQAQLYRQVAPITAQRHRDWSLETRTNYEFANRSNWVPLAGTEFSAAAADFPIVFLASEQDVQPVVLLGVKPDENLYLDEQGKWSTKYIPAFVRRYPFAFSKSKGDDKFTLCIDELYSGWNKEGRGKTLFDSTGEGSEFLNKMFRFVTEYQRQYDATLAFCRKLKELDLLEPMTARFKMPSGKNAQLTGFLAIDRDKLKTLPGDKFSELAKTGELELIYLHLQSMCNFNAMLARLTEDGTGGDMAIAPDGSWH